MKKAVLFIGFTFLINFLKAQNLVPNPGFELFYDCPTQIAEFKLVKNWFSGNTGTPEYLRTDCEYNYGSSHSGKGYSGAIFFGQYPKAIEYFMVKLKDSLIADSSYCLSFWLRAEDSFIHIDQIGMHLSTDNLKLRMWAPIYLTPSLKSKYSEPIIPQLGWYQVQGEYLSNGGESYLTIGNFTKPDRHIQYVNEFHSSFQNGWNSYYYVDDVAVRMKKGNLGCKEEEFVEQISEKKPGPLFLNVFFEIDKSTFSSIERNKLLTFVGSLNGNSIKYIEVSGHTDSIASEQYNIELSKKRTLQVEEFLVENLQNDSSIKLNYFGESEPAELNSSEKGRSKNRRVEIKVVYHD